MTAAISFTKVLKTRIREEKNNCMVRTYVVPTDLETLLLPSHTVPALYTSQAATAVKLIQIKILKLTCSSFRMTMV